MWKFIIFVSCCVFVLSCSKSENCVEIIKDDCVCTLQYDPVCGCNNKTYGNACAAACASIEVEYSGECRK